MRRDQAALQQAGKGRIARELTACKAPAEISEGTVGGRHLIE